MRAIIIIIAVISLLTCGITRIIKSEIIFERNCRGYLKRAADANTVELAKKELSKVISYCEANELMHGYTSIIYTTPDEDIEFWYNNLKSSLNELEALDENATQLEKSNMLMKLRETILDNTQGGSKVTYPSGLSIYPYNTAYMLWALLSFALMAISIFVIWREGLLYLF